MGSISILFGAEQEAAITRSPRAKCGVVGHHLITPASHVNLVKTWGPQMVLTRGDEMLRSELRVFGLHKRENMDAWMSISDWLRALHTITIMDPTSSGAKLTGANKF